MNALWSERGLPGLRLPVLRLAAGAWMLALADAAHASTPMMLPSAGGDVQLSTSIDLPVPPAPRVARPDVTRMPLVIREPSRGCGDHGAARRRGTLQQQHAPGHATGPATVSGRDDTARRPS